MHAQIWISVRHKQIVVVTDIYLSSINPSTTYLFHNIFDNISYLKTSI